MGSWERYKIEDAELRFLNRSAMRVKVLLNLMEGDRTARALRNEMGCTGVRINHVLRELINEHLIIKSAQEYVPTNIGRILGVILDEYVSAIATLDQFEDFFLDHDLGSMPSMYQKMIGMLYQEQLMEFDSDAPFSKQQCLIKAMRESKEIRCVSSIIDPRYPDAIANSVRNGAEVDLVLTKKIFRHIQINHSNLMKELFGRDNLRFNIANASDIKIAFMVTESNLFLGLYRFDGSYDMENIIVCRGEEPRRWGLSLFEYYRENSKPIENLS